MTMRHLGLASAMVSCALFSACPDDKKASNDTANDTDTTADSDTAEPDTSPDTTPDTAPDTEDDTTQPDTSEDTGPDTDTVAPQPGNGEVEALDPEARGLFLPFDSALSPDGTEVYYVAMVGAGDVQAHQLFRSIDGEETQLSTGAGFLLPLGVLTDGTNVYVMDAGYLPEGADANTREGAIMSVAKGGGAPVALAGTQGLGPVNGDVAGGTITFTGRQPNTGTPGVFTISSAGGTPTEVLVGGILRGPSGVVRTTGGMIYVSDPIADQGRGAILEIEGANARILVGGLSLGTPSGIALSADQQFLLVSALDPATETSVVHRVELATGEIVDTYQPDNIKTNREAGGLHCARDTEECVWADLTAEGDGTGIVYRVKLK